MKKVILGILVWLAILPVWASDGVGSVKSQHSFRETVDRLDKTLTAKGVTVFAKFNHSAEAQKVGLTLRPTIVYVVGNPKAGTPIMVRSQLAAIDLPLKILVMEDSDGAVWLAFNTAHAMMQKHGIPEDVGKPFGAAMAIANEVAGAQAIPAK